MTMLLYTIGMKILKLVLRIYGLFNPKINAWNNARAKHFENTIQSFDAHGKQVYWVHCASLGEFEQALPVLKSLRENKQNIFILLTFFSPSGYTQRKNTPFADMVLYAPLDDKNLTKLWIDTVKPVAYIGVKYEIWLHTLRDLQHRQIPTYFIGFLATENKYFLKSYLSIFKTTLQNCTHIFVQNESSKNVLSNHGFKNVTVSGDPRVDSVLQRKTTVKNLSEIEKWLNPSMKTIIYGSVYLSDMPYLKESLSRNDFQHIVVPHNVDKHYVENLQSKLPQHNVHSLGDNGHNVLVVDVVGKLFDLYQYGNAVYIGGGFERNIHNTLEPAVYYLPLFFGPKHQSFIEAVYFVKHQTARVVTNQSDLWPMIETSLEPSNLKEIKINMAAFFESQKGATDRISI
jgi:3-deoxy-D-manno-octulosonic-acid transferase